MKTVDFHTLLFFWIICLPPPRVRVFEWYYLTRVKARQRRCSGTSPDGTEMAIAGQRCFTDAGRYRPSIYFYKVKVDTTTSDTTVLPASKDKEGSRERWALKRRCTSLNKRRDTSMFDISGKKTFTLMLHRNWKEEWHTSGREFLRKNRN